ncbi:MAG TPA: NUDIX domain-containing protein [Patescibacteria group bacterium]|nr:NUDIX domain-containing protein [Patescibacteria group bacterium]
MSDVKRFLLRSAVYLIPIKDNKILLAKRFNTGWMDGMYSLISGHLDGNESVTSAIIREAYEEAKIKVAKNDLEPATVLHRKSDQEYVDFFFVTKRWDGEPSIGEPDKCDDLRWTLINDLPDNTLPYIKDVIDNYRNRVAFSESGWE